MNGVVVISSRQKACHRIAKGCPLSHAVWYSVHLWYAQLPYPLFFPPLLALSCTLIQVESMLRFSITYTSLPAYTILGAVTTIQRNRLRIHLYPLTGIGHLLVGFRLAFRFFLLRIGHQSQSLQTRYRLSGRREYLRFFSQRYSSMRPSFGFLRRMSRMSLSPPGCARWNDDVAIWTGMAGTVCCRPTCFSRSIYDWFRSYFLAAWLTIYFSAYFIRDRRYFVLCIILFMEDAVLSVTLGAMTLL